MVSAKGVAVGVGVGALLAFLFGWMATAKQTFKLTVVAPSTYGSRQLKDPAYPSLPVINLYVQLYKGDTLYKTAGVNQDTNKGEIPGIETGQYTMVVTTNFNTIVCSNTITINADIWYAISTPLRMYPNTSCGEYSPIPTAVKGGPI